MLLGDIIKQYRTQHQLSLQDFADLIGSSRSYIHMLEKNVNPTTNKPISPSIETLKLLAQAMHMDLDYLLKLLNNNQEIYLDEDEYKKQFSTNTNFRYANHNGINTEGLDENDIEEINRFVEFIKNKKKNEKK
jgi:transcriptional regulator with XRE-family HTH domain